MRCSSRLSAGGGRSVILNGNSRPVKAVAESGDMVGDNDEVEDLNEDALKC
jgi:hypothetical protein